MVIIWLMIVNNAGWWLTYPSEKWWSSSVGITIPNIWKNTNVPNHQPAIVRVTSSQLMAFDKKKHFSEDICPVYNRLSLNFWLFRTIVRSIDNRNCSPKYGEMGSPMFRNIPLMITDYIMINKNNIIIYIYMWTASKHHLPPSELRIAPSSNNYLQQYPSNLTNWHFFYALGNVPLGQCNS